MFEKSEETLKEKVRKLPRKPGVYLMKDRLGTIIYVGKAKNLKNRVSSYFQKGRRPMMAPKIKMLVELISDFEFHVVRSETEALLLEGRLIKELKPKYNTDFTDDKQFIQIRVDLQAEMPAFRVVRVRTTDRARYFGPFPHSTEVRRTLSQLRKKFGIVLGDTHPQKLPDGRWRLYNDVRAEIYGHANELSAEEYRARVAAACDFLEGRDRDEVARLTEEMLEASKSRDYERAMKLRDRVAAIKATLEKSRRFIRGNPLPDPVSPREALVALGEALSMKESPRTMECFDISHISGTFVVSSCVHFCDGIPAKNEYRHFRIKGYVGNDDFRSMHETIFRRYGRLYRENKPFPDLIVIDGGIGQVHSALEAFAEIGAEPPMMIGMAKREEYVIFHDGRDPLKLPDNSPALRLLQRLRDEAHRFANSYNADLRSKKIRESVLDDMPGLGEKRKAILLAKFKTIARLKSATIEELRETEGIGEVFARELREFLDKN
ncbi:MAG: excinuclease ABC subunit UvrC [Opitutae bacterium]|nr:excinuclease ABC subunit UvrC [Opitutae bacterium]